MPCSSDSERLASEIRAQGFCSRSNRRWEQCFCRTTASTSLGHFIGIRIYSGTSATRAGFEVVHTHRKMLNFSAFKISVPEAQRDRCLNAMHP